jgi:hypothetical protein
MSQLFLFELKGSQIEILLNYTSNSNLMSSDDVLC